MLFQALKMDSAATTKEQRLNGESQTRPGDIFHPDFEDGKPTFFDITVCNSFQPNYVNQTAIEAGTATAAGGDEKEKKHGNAVASS